MKKSIPTLALSLIMLTISLPNLLLGQAAAKDTSSYERNEYDISYNAITTTPFTLPKGAFLYQNFNLVVNTLSYGFTDNLSVSVGTSLHALLNDRRHNYATLMSQIKYNFYQDEKYAFSVSNINFYEYEKYYNFQIDENERNINVVPILFVNGSVHTSKHAFWTFGVGMYGLLDDPQPIFTIGYQNRFSKNMAFIADLWVPLVEIESSAGPLPIPALGVRFFKKDRGSIDLGFPFIGAKVPIGKIKSRSLD